MINAALYTEGSNTIDFFIKNAVLFKNKIAGDNAILRGKGFRDGTAKILWTEQDVTPIIDTDENSPTFNEIIGYQEGISDLVESTNYKPELNQTLTSDVLIAALEKRHEIAQLTFDQLDTYIETNVVDLASAKDFLKKLAKVVLGQIKISDHFRSQS